jgi:hypothetical protein
MIPMVDMVVIVAPVLDGASQGAVDRAIHNVYRLTTAAIRLSLGLGLSGATAFAAFSETVPHHGV